MDPGLTLKFPRLLMWCTLFVLMFKPWQFIGPVPFFYSFSMFLPEDVFEVRLSTSRFENILLDVKRSVDLCQPVSMILCSCNL